MLGYTIDKSIELLEKRVKALESGGGGGGASNWDQLQNKPFNSLGEEFYNLDGELTVNVVSSDKIALPDSEAYTWDYVSQGIEALAEDSNHFSDDIAELQDTKQDSLTPGNNITIIDNVISVDSIYDYTERVVGTFVNKPIYCKLVDTSFDTGTSQTAWVGSTVIGQNIESILDAKAYNDDFSAMYTPEQIARSGDTNVRFRFGLVDNRHVAHILVTYTKSTD